MMSMVSMMKRAGSRRMLVALGAAFGLASAAVAESPGAPQMPGQKFGHGETRSITEAEANRYLAALEELMAAANQHALDVQGPQGQQTMAALAMNEHWQAILGRHGFDGESFGIVHGSLWQAFMALQLEAQAPQMKAMVQQNAAMLEQMKQHMSKEDYDRAVAGMAEAEEQMKALGADVPAGNLDVVRKLEAKLKAFSESH